MARSAPAKPATPVAAVLLAAGLGKRMKSATPKVAFGVCGWPMVRHVAEAVRALGVEKIVVVVGHGRDAVKTALDGVPGVSFAVQKEQKGTGDAVKAAGVVVDGVLVVQTTGGEVSAWRLAP